MSISSITQWLASYGTGIGNSLTAISPWQIGIATIVAAVALPKFVKLAASYFQKPAVPQLNNPPIVNQVNDPPIVPRRAELFHKWYVEGKEIRFFKEENALRIEVIRLLDNFKLVDSYLDLLPPLKDLDIFTKMDSLTKEFELSGWGADGFPIFIVRRSEHIRTWILAYQSISLICQEGNLVWKFSDNESTYWAPVTEFQDLNRQERIDKLLTLYQPLKWDPNANSPKLISTIVRPYWLFGNREISLTVRQGQLMWQLLNNTLKTVSWRPLNPELLKDIPLNDRIERLYCQIIDPHRSKIGGKEIEGLCLKTEDMHSSQFNPQVTFDNDRWAVTLVDLGQCEQYEVTTWGGHAAIVIEGIEENLPFIQISDLVPNILDKPNGIVSSKEDRVTTKIKHAGKTDTWLVTKDKVRRMINDIRLERDRPYAFPVEFNKYGIDSEVTDHPAHNCITWAAEKLSIVDIILKPGLLSGYFGKLFTAPKFYTK